ncbi:DMT family transporter [Rubrivirga sp. IMCC45206]|uniref:DMT family transporter n=1 Tax=Rubrivirga sp. IMCC45206 TaxID=3391614 RepID=UPI00398FF2D1
MRRALLAPEVGLLAVVLVWGVNFAVIKVPLDVAPPFTVNALRFAVSVLVLGGLHLRQSRQRGVSPLVTFQTGGVGAVVGLGLLGILLYQVGFIVGIDRVSSGTGALLIATSPAWTALTAHLLKQERLLALGWAGFAASLGGVALVVVGNPAAAFEGDGSGFVLMLAAALAWGVYTTLARPVLDRGATPLGLTFWGIVVSAPGLIALAAPEVAGVEWGAFGVWEVAAILFSGGLSTGLAYAIWNTSVQTVGASKTAAFSNLVPVVGVIAGVALRGEQVTPLQVVGGVLIVAGVVVVRRFGIAATPGPLPPVVD